MAASVVIMAEVVPVVQTAPKTVPALPYALNDNSAEQAVPIPLSEMQGTSEIRSRPAGRLRQSFNNHDGDSSEVEQTSTPSTRSTDQQPQGILSVTASVWRTIFGSFFSSSASQPPHAEPTSVRLEKLKHERIDEAPKGIPRLAAFMNNDDKSAVFRRFGQLSSRVLLHLEIELTELEQKLSDLDAADAANPIMQPRLNGYEIEGGGTAQQDLISDGRLKLDEYFGLLLKTIELNKIGRASRRDHMHLFNWTWNNKPLGKGKDDFIFHVGDFISATKPAGKGRKVEDLIELYLQHFPKSRIKNFVQTEVELSSTRDEFADLHSRDQLEMLAKTLMAMLAAGILLIPVFLLFLVPMSHMAMCWLVFGFVLIFSGMMSVLTEAKVQEVFVGTAAFGAVLVSFLGNLNHGK